MNCLECDLRRAVLSVRFFLGALIQLGILFFQGPSSTLYKMSIPLVCTFPYACGWLDEYRSGFVKLALPRGSRRSYILGKFLAVIISGGGAEVLAAWAYLLLKEGAEERGLGLLFFSGALWAAAAAILAALSNSKYLAYGGAFVVYYFLVILCERYWKRLYCLYPYEWLAPEHSWVLGDTGVMLMLGGLLVAMCMIFYEILQRSIERV